MSCEGYYQVLCENGHLSAENDMFLDYLWLQEDGVDDPQNPWRCRYCGSSAVWHNFVDETNGPEIGKVELEVKTPVVKCSCDKCGNEHIANPATYVIPK